MLTLQHVKYLLLFSLQIQFVLGEEKWYKAADGSNYLIILEDQYNWYESLVECASRGLNLVGITSEAKNRALIDVLKKIDNRQFWIGGVGYMNGNGQLVFNWITTGEQFDYTNWFTRGGEPNGKGLENCVHLRPDYHWNDHNCVQNKFSLICEQSPRVTKLKNYIDLLESFVKQ